MFVSEVQLETNARATAEQPCQDLVLLFSKLVDRAITGHLQHAIRDGLFQFRRNVWVTESLHQAGPGDP